MRKYWAFFKTSAQNTLTYRGPILVWLASNLITLTVIVFVWFSVQSNGMIGGYSKNQLITYYLFGLFVSYLVNWHPFYWLKDEIANGDIVGSTLLKPLSLFSKAFAQEVGWHTVSIWVGLVSFILVGFIIRDFLVFPTQLANILLVSGAVGLAIMINFIVMLCMGMVAFWTPRVNQLEGLFWIGRTLFGGQGVPISFFPAAYQILVRALPFRYMFSFPIEIFLGKLSSAEIINGFFLGSCWVGLLILTYKFMWARGRVAYTAYGH